MNGAESLVRSLIGSGVDICFTNPGTSEMHFVAALDQVAGMRAVLALFEGVATGAADGYFRMARKPACTLLHLGPGLANGLANLHNAKKAGSGVVNIVGEHAASHIALEAPLTSDIRGIAAPVSHWVHTSRAACDAGRDGAAAVAQANRPPGRIATLILPCDTAWSEGGALAEPHRAAPMAAPDCAKVARAAAALDGADTLLLLGGEALGEGGLETAGKIAAGTGCGLLAEWSNARAECGAGRVFVGKVPYPIDQALAALAPYRRIVLAGARAPIGFFAYPGKPAVLSRDWAEIIELAGMDGDPAGALAALCDELGAGKIAPAGVSMPEYRDVPSGPITPETIAAVLARAIPDNAIVVDEAITTGRRFFPATAAAAPHTWLNNCGGSIGYGLPVATGAAIACPDRKVLALIGDGSAMYTVQAIWTMAREGLDVTIVIFANRAYQILRGELRDVGVQNPGPRAVDMLSLDRPELQWVDIARAMGAEARRVETCEDLSRALKAGLATPGPYLIEAMM
jgi:acetolactate synthase I/II/III large subunit